jgi:hypothetical protein
MEREVHRPSESLRAHARAVRAASGELRARARTLRHHARKLCADTAALRARLAAALELASPGDKRPGERERTREALRASLASLFTAAAAALEHTARLAERHAAREQAAGRPVAADRRAIRCTSRARGRRPWP